MDTTETRIYTAFLIGSLVAGALLFYFAMRMRRLHKKHFELLRRSYWREVELLEQERNRIARDLHDELGPLVSIACTLIQNSRGADADDVEFLGKAEQSLVELTEKFREIARNLSADALHANGLQFSIERFLSRCRTASKIDFQFQSRVTKEPAAHFSLQVYRIVQELVHNAIKHSGAQTVQIQLIDRKNMLYLFYEDDGVGMPAGIEVEGMGIKGMRSRVTMLHGMMETAAGHKGGTRYSITLPIQLKDV